MDKQQTDEQRPDDGQVAEHPPHGTASEEAVRADAEEDREAPPENESGDPLPLEQPAEG